MAKLLKAYRPDGTVRAVWRDEVAPGFRKAGVLPRRASNVEVVEEGPNRGKFYADMSRLADLAGDDSLRVCLLPFDSYEDAIAAEVRWIEQNWVLGRCHTGDVR